MKGYKARNSPQQVAPALPHTAGGATETALGAYVALYSNGTNSIIAGTATRLFRLVSGAWQAIGSGYTATFPWVFTQFSDDVLATSAGNTNIQVAAGPTGTFSNLAGSPPTNSPTIISVAGFAAAYKTNEWFNSAAGTDNNWTPSTQTQAANGFLYDYPGNIVAAAALLRTQIIWKANSMYLLTYVGSTQVWSSQILSANVGTFGQGCVCPMPTAIAFLGTDDFYICQGAAPSRIPNNMKEWFFITADPNQLANVSSWYDPLSATCYWHFVSLQPPYPGMCDRYVGWNSRSGRWVPGYLDTPLVVWNTQPPSQQSGLYFDVSGNLQSWTGTPTTMSITTGLQGDQDNLTQLQKVRVSYTTWFEPTSQICVPMHVYRLGDAPTVEPVATLANDGWHNLRATDRYHQVQLSTNGPCEAMTLAYEGRLAGVR